MAATLTFLGAARTVTGSRYLVEAGGTARAGRLRHVPGAQGAAAAQLGRSARAAGVDRRRGADARPPRPRGHAAAARGAGVQGPHLLHARHPGPVLARAARRRAAPGRGSRARQPQRLHEAPARAAALHRRRMPSGTLSRLQPVGYQRPIPVGSSGSAGGVHTRRSPAGRGLRPDAPGGRRGRHGALRRRPGPLQPAHPARPVRRRRPPTSCSWSPPTATACTRRTTKPDAWRRSSTRRPGSGGKLIIPSFAIGRVEEVLYAIKQLEDAGTDHGAARLRGQPHGPPGAEVLRAARRASSTATSAGTAGEVSAFCTTRFTPVATPQESRAVVERPRPGASSSRPAAWRRAGEFCTTWPTALPDPRNTVLFVGFQAAGTRGRQLIEGAQEVRIHGQFVPVQARIEKLNGMSAHADASEIVQWLRTFPDSHRRRPTWCTASRRRRRR